MKLRKLLEIVKFITEKLLRMVRSGFSSEPIVSPRHVDEVDLKDETSLSEYNDEEYNVISFNDLFPFNIYSVNDSKLHTDNDDDNKINIKQSPRDISIKPLPNDLLDEKMNVVECLFSGIIMYVVVMLESYMTKTPLPNPPTITSTESEIHAFEAAVCDDKDIARMILGSVYPELRSSLMGYTVYGMFHTIKDMYKGKAFDEILEFVNKLRNGNKSACVRLSSDVLKDYMDRLDRFESKKLNNNVIETIMKILPNKASDFKMED
uniref:Uncharacterized protein n=1 Tax=Tanacetum cinerariifolium TaxID=118510 RepID=A0A6L2N0K8_TANCI|nr:hypothetical protein [Tanacetum cinerariifolium]